MSEYTGEYIIIAKKELSKRDKRDFCERIKKYLEEGSFRFEPSWMPYTLKISSTVEEMISYFVKYKNLLTQITPENIVAYIKDDDWVITFSEWKTLGQYGKVYFRLRENKSKDFLAIRTIREVTAKFQIEWAEATPKSNSKSFFAWKIYHDWENRFSSGIQYMTQKEIHLLDSSEGIPADRVSVEPLKPEFVYYFSRIITPTERAYFTSSIPLCVELLEWEEEEYYSEDLSKKITRLRVVVKYKKEYLDIW